MNRLKKLTALAALAAVFATTGCTSQTTIAALVTTLGNASASIAAIENNPTLANQLKADTAAASQAVLNWKKGTPAQNVVQALNIVQNDLSLITGTCNTGIPGPVCQYVPLIDLAIATTTSIIQIVNPATAVPAATKGRLGAFNAPKDSVQFKKQWNKICSGNPNLVRAAIQ